MLRLPLMRMWRSLPIRVPQRMQRRTHQMETVGTRTRYHHHRRPTIPVLLLMGMRAVAMAAAMVVVGWQIITPQIQS